MEKSSIKIFIPNRMPGLNEYISAMNRNRHIGNKMKQDNTDHTAWFFKGIRQVKNPVIVQFLWHEPNDKRDPDNIVFAKKFILDGIVKAGVLPDDNQRWILGLRDYIVVEPKNVGVWVTLIEKEQNNGKNIR